MEWTGHTAAWFPATAVIGGRRLGVPTLGQWRLLECCGSPFAEGGVAGPRDAALALVLLSRPWRSGRRLLRSRWRTALATLRCPPGGASAELAEWLRAAWWVPERFDDGRGGDGFPPCAPASLRIAALAVRGRWLEMLPDPCPSVWDAPIPGLLLARVVADEISGGSYATPGEADRAAALMESVVGAEKRHPAPVRPVEGGFAFPAPAEVAPVEKRQKPGRGDDGEDAADDGVVGEKLE